MNWQNFQHHDEAPETAFEAFVTHLFELWCQRTFGEHLRHVYVLDGRGGDGGVEAFASLDDGSEVGLQAKWFHDSFDNSRIKKIQASLAQACKRHQRLKHYIVCLPNDLKDSKSSQNHKSELDRWNEFIASAVNEYPAIKIEYWGKAQLEYQIAEHDDGSISRYWFDQRILSPKDLATHFQTTVAAHFQRRYLPNLHQIGLIDKKIDEHLQVADVRLRKIVKLRHIRGEVSRLVDEIKRLSRLSDPQLKDEPVRLATSFTQDYLVKVVALVDSLEAEARSGAIYSFASVENLLPAKPQAISDLCRLLDERDRQSWGYATSHSCLIALKRFDKTLLALEALVVKCHQIFLPLVIYGPPGIGKTHGVVASAQRRIDAGLPVLLIAANDADPTNGLTSILGKTIDRPNWSTSEILNALEAAAYIADRKRANEPAKDVENEPCRALIVIDGLEESPNASAWPKRLIELAELTRDRPRIKVVITTRDTTIEHCVGGFVKQSDELILTQETVVTISDLFTAYCQYHNVKIESTPWLPWALRTPLAVRLFTEVHHGRTIQTGTMLKISIPQLLRAKIDQIESELRRDPSIAWFNQDAVLLSVLRRLAREMVDGNGWLPRNDALKIMKEIDAPTGLMTYARSASVLDICCTHGILDAQRYPSKDPLDADQWIYRPAFNTITDYLIAADIYNHIDPTSTPIALPEILRNRNDAAAIVVAMLASTGRFVAFEAFWRDSVDIATLERWQLRTLVDLPAQYLLELREWILRKLTCSMPDCRDVLNELVVHTARIQNHPYGALFVDAALRALPMGDRDLFWSGPDRIPHNQRGPWEGEGEWLLDEIDLVDSDTADGLPRLMAWSLASVVADRRIIARTKLAYWGAQNPRRMADLLIAMATVNDGQVVENLFIAAAGAALACDPENTDIGTLAETCDRLLFRDDAVAYTNNAIIRHAARTVVERAYLLGHCIDEGMLQRARPSYPLRGPDLLPFEPLAAAKNDRGWILSMDLERYVASAAVKGFFNEQRFIDGDKDPLRPLAEVDIAVLKVVASISTDAAEELKSRTQYQKAMPQSLFTKFLDLEDDKAIDDDIDNTDPDTEVTEAAMDDEELHQNENMYHAAKQLLDRYAEVASTESIRPEELVAGLITARVKSFGWTKARFIGEPNGGKNGEVLGADIAVLRVHHPETRGSRSAVAAFREKYVFIAVNEIAGYLADRLPLARGYGEEPIPVTDYGELGNGMPDPLTHAIHDGGPDDEEQPLLSDPLWIPSGLVPAVEGIVAQDQCAQAIEWLQKAPLPNMARWRHPGDERRTVLGACISTKEPESTVKIIMWMSAFVATPHEMRFLREDLQRGAISSSVFGWDEIKCGLGHAIYPSPSVACWAPWLEAVEEEKSYITLNAHQQPIPVRIRALLGSVLWEVPGIGERETWMPGPLLRDMWKLIGSTGDFRRRAYIDRRQAVVAEFTEYRDVTDYTSSHTVLTADTVQLHEAIQRSGMEIGWYIRLYREVPPALLNEAGHHGSGYTDHRSVVFADERVMTIALIGNA